MNKFKAKRAGLKRRERRVRSKICGTAERPRLSVHRTNTNIYAQVIDDVDAKTICTASTLDPEFRALGKLGSNKEAAELVGKGRRARHQGRRHHGDVRPRRPHLPRPCPGSR